MKYTMYLCGLSLLCSMADATDYLDDKKECAGMRCRIVILHIGDREQSLSEIGQDRGGNFLYLGGINTQPISTTGNVLIEIDPSNSDVLDMILKKYCLEVQRNRGKGRYTLKVSDGKNPIDIVTSMYSEHITGIKYVETDFTCQIASH